MIFFYTRWNGKKVKCPGEVIKQRRLQKCERLRRGVRQPTRLPHAVSRIFERKDSGRFCTNVLHLKSVRTGKNPWNRPKRDGRPEEKNKKTRWIQISRKGPAATPRPTNNIYRRLVGKINFCDCIINNRNNKKWHILVDLEIFSL